jgi:hypothetical protein
MKNLFRMHRFLPALLLLCAFSVPLLADGEEDTLTADATVGVQGYMDEDNNDSAKFEEYREVPSGLVLDELNLSWKPKDRWYLDFSVRDAAQKDQRGNLTFGMDKYWKAYANWQENPHRFMDDARSLYRVSGDTFLLADSLQSAIQAAPSGESTTAGTKAYILKDAVLNSADGVTVAYQRRKGELGFEATPNSHWLLRLTADRETRKGNQPWAFSFGFGSIHEAAIPVDYETDNVTAMAEYRNKHFSLGASAILSDFENAVNSLTFDNPLRATDSATGPSRGRNSYFPDSDMKQFSLFGSLRLSKSTRITANFQFGETEQNEAFLPWTINTASAAGTVDLNGDGVVDGLDDPDSRTALPKRSLGGRYDTDMFDLRATTKPLDWLSLKAWWRRYERDDRTGDFEIDGYVSNDGAYGSGGISTQDRVRLNYDYTKGSWGLGARLGYFGPAVFGLEYSRESWDRDHAAVEDSDEDIYKLTADLDVTKWLFLRATYKNQKRRADEYHAHYYEEAYETDGEPYVAAFNEGTRRFYWTDRDRYSYTLLADVTPVEKVSFYAEATYAKDKYYDPETGKRVGDSYMDDISAYVAGDETILLAGRTYDKNRTYTLGVSLAPVKRFTAYADYTWETFKYDLATRYRTIIASSYGSDDPADNWGSRVKDSYDTFDVGFHAELLDEARLLMDGSLSYSRGEGDISNWYAPGGASAGNGVDPSGASLEDFPTLRSKLTVAMLSLDRKMRKNFRMGLRWWYEKWDEDDWAVDGMMPYMGDAPPGIDNGSRTSFYLGGFMKDYDNHVVEVFARILL